MLSTGSSTRFSFTLAEASCYQNLIFPYNRTGVFIRRVVAIFAIVTVTSAAAADTLVLADDERLTGTLIDIEDGTLSFRTKLSAKVFVPVDEVRGLRTDELVTIRLGKGVRARGRFDWSAKGIVLVNERGRPQPVDLTHVQGIARVREFDARDGADEPASTAPTSIRGSLAGGYVLRSGTREYRGAGAELALSGNHADNDFSAQAQVEYVGDDPDFERFFDAEGRASRNLADGWTPQLVLEVERNRNKALQLRSDITMGMGRRILEDESQRLEGFAGIGVAIERFDVQPLRRDQNVAPTGEPQVDREAVNLNIGLGYRLAIGNELTFVERVLARPSLSNPGDVRAELESAVSLPLLENLTMKLDLSLDFEDEQRYRDIEALNTRFGASLRLDF